MNKATLKTLQQSSCKEDAFTKKPISRRSFIKGSTVLSIAKDHTGTRFSGTMKNMMGATSGSTNSFFHHGSGKGFGYYDDIEFLSQCIADVNLVRKPFKVC